MRVFITLLTFGAALLLAAVVAYFAVFLLAGPHGGALPASLHTATLLLAWVLVLGIPTLLARRVWRRLAPARGSEPGES